MFTSLFNDFCYLNAEALTGILVSETIKQMKRRRSAPAGEKKHCSVSLILSRTATYVFKKHTCTYETLLSVPFVQKGLRVS